MRSRRHLAVALTLAVALLSGACATASPDATAAAASTDPVDPQAIRPLADPGEPQLPTTLTSADGREVTVASAERIVPLNGAIAEIVFSLGLADHVVGRDATTTFAEAAHLPAISTGHDTSAEGVLSLEPDLVIGDTRSGPPEVLDQIRAAGVPVLLVEESWTIDGIAPRIETISTALGVPEAGTRLANRTLEEIVAARPSEDNTVPARVAFLYLRGGAGITLLGGAGSGADEMIEALGATDVGSEMGLGPYTPLTSEALVAAAPDVLLLMTEGLASVGGVDGLLELPGVAQTPAGQARRVVAVEDGVLLNFGPRTGATLRVLADELRAVRPPTDAP